MKTLNRNDERFILNYIQNHPMQWTMYRMGGRMDIIFNLDNEIERFTERVKSDKEFNWSIQKKFYKRNNDSLKFFKLLKEKFGDEHDSALTYWKELGIRESKVIKQYKLRPIIERKDNKNSLNYGSGSSGSSTIRYPKKNRKTAWKRFFKLFPHLDPNNKKD